jgi:hypothetical protein
MQDENMNYVPVHVKTKAYSIEVHKLYLYPKILLAPVQDVLMHPSRLILQFPSEYFIFVLPFGVYYCKLTTPEENTTRIRIGRTYWPNDTVDNSVPEDNGRNLHMHSVCVVWAVVEAW